jgi:hypothetical protein
LQASRGARAGHNGSRNDHRFTTPGHHRASKLQGKSRMHPSENSSSYANLVVKIQPYFMTTQAGSPDESCASSYFFHSAMAAYAEGEATMAAADARVRPVRKPAGEVPS